MARPEFVDGLELTGSFDGRVLVRQGGRLLGRLHEHDGEFCVVLFHQVVKTINRPKQQESDG